MKLKRIFGTGLLFCIFSTKVCAKTAADIIAATICSLIPELLALAVIVAALMFTYGGAKYAFSADDPGGRKQGKSIMIQTIIALLIIVMSKAIIEAIAGATVCP